MIWTRTAVALVATLICSSIATAAEKTKDQDPLEIKRSESVEVRLVTLDVVVTDREGKTVPDLQTADFELTVDGVPTRVDTLDATCPSGPAAMPLAGHLADWKEPPTGENSPRRIVLAFDYLHIARADPVLPAAVLHYLQRKLPSAPQGLEEIMVVVFDGALRVEQPFTRDREEVLRTLRRMDHDVTLYGGYFEHSTEGPFFNGLQSLLDLLDLVPGTKALVLFSAGNGPGPFYDPSFLKVAERATSARTSIYPVSCEGLLAGRFT